MLVYNRRWLNSFKFSKCAPCDVPEFSKCLIWWISLLYFNKKSKVYALHFRQFILTNVYIHTPEFTLFLETVSLFKSKREVFLMWVHLQTDITLPKEVALNRVKGYQFICTFSATVIFSYQVWFGADKYAWMMICMLVSLRYIYVTLYLQNNFVNKPTWQWPQKGSLENSLNKGWAKKVPLNNHNTTASLNST